MSRIFASAGAQDGHHDTAPSLRATENGQYARQVLVLGAKH